MSNLTSNISMSFSSQLACQYGLEEAVMLNLLEQSVFNRGVRGQDGNLWCKLEQARVEILMGFWTLIDVQRILTSLSKQGAIVVDSAPIITSGEIIFRLIDLADAPIVQATKNHTQTTSRAPTTPFHSAMPIAPNWQPAEDDLRTLTQYGVSREFALSQLHEFVSYWRQRGTANNAWGSKFAAQVRRKWREHQQEQAELKRNQPIAENWQPGGEVIDILVVKSQIPEAFVSDCIPEYRLYWKERGQPSNAWDSKFLTHVKRQWDIYQQKLKYDTAPRPIPANWQPEPDVIDILKIANIDLEFAVSLVGEFVLYWRESNQLNSSWNSKFLQHVKHRWAQRHNEQDLGFREENGAKKATRDTTTGELVTDRSWAN